METTVAIDYNYKTIRIIESVSSSLLVGSTIGVFAWYLKDHDVDNSLIAMTSGAMSGIALLNIYIKKLHISTVEVIWFIVNILLLISLFALPYPLIFLPLTMIMIGANHVLYDHIESHYLDSMKNTLNIRDLNSDIATVAGLASIISIPIAMSLSCFYTDIFYGLTIASYILLDVVVIHLYRRTSTV